MRRTCWCERQVRTPHTAEENFPTMHWLHVYNYYFKRHCIFTIPCKFSTYLMTQAKILWEFNFRESFIHSQLWKVFDFGSDDEMGENDSSAERLDSQGSPDACLPWQRKVAQTEEDSAEEQTTILRLKEHKLTEQARNKPNSMSESCRVHHLICPLDTSPKPVYLKPYMI